jgi:hypothetical protein
METATLAAGFPYGTPPNHRKNWKTAQKIIIERMETAF